MNKYKMKSEYIGAIIIALLMLVSGMAVMASSETTAVAPAVEADDSITIHYIIGDIVYTDTVGISVLDDDTSEITHVSSIMLDTIGEGVLADVDPPLGQELFAWNSSPNLILADENGDYVFEHAFTDGDVYTFTAGFNECVYTITFLSSYIVGGTTIVTCGYGATVIMPEMVDLPTDQDFLGWSDGTHTYGTDAVPTATESVTYTAVFSEPTVEYYTVTFMSNGIIVAIETVEDGEYAVEPKFEGYSFDVSEPVTEDTTIIAVANPIVEPVNAIGLTSGQTSEYIIIAAVLFILIGGGLFACQRTGLIDLSRKSKTTSADKGDSKE
ncbi:MAG: hypothetical protein WC096_00510 [Sphaerochaetaceae bacterium]